MYVRRPLFVFVATGLLAACGGGGGGGPDPSGVRITEHTEQITFATSDPTRTPWDEYVELTVEGAKAADLYYGAMPSGQVMSLLGEPGSSSEYQGHVSLSAGRIEWYVPGVYEGSLTIQVCTNASCSGGQVVNSPLTIPLRYEISGFWSRPGALRFGVGSAPLASDRTQTFLVGVNPSQSWTVATDVAWLSVTPTSASGGPVVVTAALVEAELGGLTDGTHEGRITVTPESGSAIELPVVLVVDRSHAGPELVTNGGFGSGMANWFVQTAMGSRGTAAVVGGEMRVTPVVPTVQLGWLNLRSHTMALQSGQRYRLSFTARADAPRKLFLGVHKPIAPGGTYLSETVLLSTSARQYAFDFTMPESANADIWFGFGGDPAPVVFDDVSLHAIP